MCKLGQIKKEWIHGICLSNRGLKLLSFTTAIFPMHQNSRDEGALTEQGTVSESILRVAVLRCYLCTSQLKKQL